MGYPLPRPTPSVDSTAEGARDAAAAGGVGEAGDVGETAGLKGLGPVPPPGTPGRGAHPARPVAAERPDLLDGVARWEQVPTAAGVFRLLPVELERDLGLLHAWMNDPTVAAYWELAGPATRTEAHIAAQLDGDGRSVPALGLLDGVPMSYWELYRADLDPLASYCRVLPHDTGVHLLIGADRDRGRGLGTLLLRTVADLVLAHRPRCTRVLAEPDLRNHPSLAAFRAAGFRDGAQVALPSKRAALMVRDRAVP